MMLVSEPIHYLIKMYLERGFVVTYIDTSADRRAIIQAISDTPALQVIEPRFGARGLLHSSLTIMVNSYDWADAVKKELAMMPARDGILDPITILVDLE